VDLGEPLGNGGVVQSGAILTEVLVGARDDEQNEHGHRMEQRDHDPARNPPLRQYEESYPQQHVSQIEEYVRAHQTEDAGEPVISTGQKGDAVSLQRQIVDHERHQQAEQVNPFPTA
jgi:hypothetical protein